MQDDLSEISDLDVALSSTEQSPEENASSPCNMATETTCSQASNVDDPAMSQLDELLLLDTRDFDDDSSFPWSENLFLGHEFPLSESLGAWPLDCLPEFPPLCASPDISCPADEPEENVSHVFSQWLHSNAHRFSLSDLRKIKLKTSTVEAATRRLGGGKKGMMYFLKLLLIWIQNHHIKRKHPEGSKSRTNSQQEVDFSSNVACNNGSSSYTLLDNRNVREERGLNDPAVLQQGGMFLGSSAHCTDVSTPTALQNMHPEHQNAFGSVDTLYSNSLANVKAPSGHDWNFLPTTDDNAGPPNSFFGACNSCSFSPRIARQGNLLHTVSPPAVQERNPQLFTAANLGSYTPMSDSFSHRPSTPAATTRAARKSRMERQRWSVRRHRRWSNLPTAANLSWPSQALGAASLNLPYRPRSSHRLSRSTLEFQQSRRAERNLRLLFQKELKQSDVGNLGRIVLPKAAETSLPPLERDGVNLFVEDMTSSKTWNMRYRFWPNNKSRMYLLENTGDFVKSYDLKEGDYMMLYTNNLNNKYMIRGAKGELQRDAACAVSKKADSDLSIHSLTNPIGNVHGSSGTVIASESTCDDSMLAELIEQSLEDVSET